MTRAAIYARYSSDLQSAASADDQIAICKERIAREGWTLAGIFVDEGISGASVLRPGYQNLLQAARSGGCDVVVAEDQLRAMLADTPLSQVPMRTRELLGEPWDEALEPYRLAGDGAPVTWLYQVG